MVQTLSPDGILAMTHPDDRDRFNQTLLRGLECSEGYEIDHRIVLRDGAERIVHTRGAIEVDNDAGPLMMRGTVHDVAGARTSEAALRVASDRLQHLATTDALTGLPNRGYLWSEPFLPDALIAWLEGYRPSPVNP
ncbi:MAG: PAS domain-containing protein [Actinomycetota bacterium]|nr:PAS domain-containing protein [Actinomycetota bacterium]